MILRIVLNVTVCALGQCAVLAAYDRMVVRPRTAMATVDVASVFKAKEQQFSKLLIAAQDDAGRDKAMAVARDFADRYPRALEELAAECQCLLVDRSVVIGHPQGLPDITDRLRAKVP